MAALQIVDSILSMQSAAQIADIYARVLASQRAIVESKQRILAQENAAFNYYRDVLQKLGTAHTETTAQVIKLCDHAVLSREIIVMQSCLEKTRESINEYALLAQIQKSLAMVHFTSPQIPTFLSAYGISQNFLFAKAKEIEKEVQQEYKNLDEKIHFFNRAASQFFMDQIREKQALSVVESSMTLCSQRFDAFISRASMMRELIKSYGDSQNSDPLIQGLIKLDLQSLIHSAGNLEDTGCFEITSDHMEMFSNLGRIQSKELFQGQKVFIEEKNALLSAIPNSLMHD